MTIADRLAPFADIAGQLGPPTASFHMSFR
jgi:hypothetical protein